MTASLKPKCVVYLRLSRSDDASTSIERQEADCRRRADGEGWDVVSVLVDDGLSGGKRREKADQALTMIRTGSADVLLTWKFDRWSRMGLSAVADLIDVLDTKKGALFAAEKDGLNSSQPAWRIVAAVLSEVARTERENTQIRIKSSIANLRKSGRFPGGKVPFGYKSVDNPHGAGKVLEIDSDTAKILRYAADQYLGGKTFYAISRDLNNKGWLFRNATRWNVMTLSRVLTSDAIAGFAVHHGDLVRDESGEPIQFWDAVVEIDTVRRIRAGVEANRPAPSTRARKEGARLLSGLVFCVCGTPMNSWTSNRGYTSYTCPGNARGKDCNGGAISSPRLEEFVSQEFLARYGNLEIMTLIESPSHQIELAETEASINATLDLMREDDADLSNLSERLRMLKARRSYLQNIPSVPTVLEGTGKTYLQAWQESEGQEDEREIRRSLINPNILGITINKGIKGRKGPVDRKRAIIEFNAWRFTEQIDTSKFISNYATLPVALIEDVQTWGRNQGFEVEEGRIAISLMETYQRVMNSNVK